MNTNQFPTLYTKRLLLRQIMDSDLPNIYNGLSNEKVIQYYGISYTSMEATKEQMAFYKDIEQKKTGIFWAICSLDNKQFYGVGGYHNWHHAFKKAEISFWLLPEFWGQGMMQEALATICNYGFTTMELHRIEGFVESDNHLCKNAMNKLEFSQEGCMKDCEIKNGKFISLEIYAKFNQ